MRGGRYGTGQVLGADAMRELHAGTAATGHGTYASGWQNSTLDGTGARAVWHAGAAPGSFTHLVPIPEADLAVVVMTNIYGLPMDAPLAAGAFGLARLELGAAPAPPAAADPLKSRVIAALLLGCLVAAVVRLPRGTAMTSRRRALAVARLAGGVRAMLRYSDQ